MIRKILDRTQNLTIAQSYVAWLSTSFIIALIWIWIFFKLSELMFVIGILSGLIIIPITSVLIFGYVFCIPSKEIEKDNQVAKKRCISKLNIKEGVLTELEYRTETLDEISYILSKVYKDGTKRFYVTLNEQNDIVFVVRGEKGETVFDVIIENHVVFEEKFIPLNE